MPSFTIQRDMHKAGFNDVAVSLAVRSLKMKGLISISKDYNDRDNYEYTAISLTENGDEWILNNQDKIDISYTDPDLPF